MTEPVTVYIGLGSNQGDRRTQIEDALRQLDRVPGVSLQRVSSLRESQPVGGPEQDAFLNGVAELSCRLTPDGLLQVLKQLEWGAGRDPLAPRNSPRPLDLDILLYGDLHLDQRDLRVPHPRMAMRSFVIEPLHELGVKVDELALPAAPYVVREPATFAAACSQWLQGGCATALVPTMGALHEGHLSLVRLAGAECDRVAATIFVNPLQFNQSQDLQTYPQDLDRDLELLANEGVDMVFVPEAPQMYPANFCSHIGVGVEAEDLEGASRPGHFQGVATVVAKLLAMARPTRAYFGEKDAQQLAVIRRMVDDLGFPVALRPCPIVREADGLAMSSRNQRLTDADRQAASTIFRALNAVRDAHNAGERDAARLLHLGMQTLQSEPRLHLDYLELRSEGRLRPLPAGEPIYQGRILCAVICKESNVRLIDNMALGTPEVALPSDWAANGGG